MSQKKARYITTTLPYVNADPHVGFALEIVQADALARYWRLMGHEVFFNTGTDEHGQKIAQKADEAGRDRQEYADHYAKEFNTLKGALNLSYDKFIRTTDEDHKKAAQHIWKLCEANGDIYKKKYTGLYCVGDEMFVKESELVNGMCPNHPTMAPIEVEEENYFFRLSKYQDQLLDYLRSEPFVITPSWQQQWAIDFVEQGLEDLSISRQKSRMDWGIPVPGDDEQVMYVWFDALTNYISTLGWPEDKEGNFKKFWEEGETLQLAGKDQVRFQSIIWQAMLMSAGVRGTDHVYYHGFINSGGQKMSKSLGNVISPYDMVERYGTDATRYMLLRHIHPFDDSDITWERMDEWYTANLVNGLGNLTARIMKMAETHLEEPVSTDFLKKGEYEEIVLTKAIWHYFSEDFAFQRVLDLIWSEITGADQLIQETQPFKLINSVDAEEVIRGYEIIEQLVHKLAVIAFHLRFALPATAEIIQEAIKENKKPDNLFKRLEE